MGKVFFHLLAIRCNEKQVLDKEQGHGNIVFDNVASTEEALHQDRQ